MSVVGIAKERVLLREKRTDNTERYYKRTFLVEVNNLKDDANIVETAFGLPYRGLSYVTDVSVDTNALCYTLSTKQIGLYHWEVEAEYSSEPTKISGSSKKKDPLFEPPKITWGITTIREAVIGQSHFEKRYQNEDPSDFEVTLFDSTGILNSAYEPYIPPAEMDRAIPTLTYERNEPVFNNQYMLWYVHSVNEFIWYRWWPRTVKVNSITGTLEYKEVNGVMKRYWKVKYEFHFNKYTWDLFLLDQGTYYLEGGSTVVPLVRKPFMTKGVAGVGLLTANGDKSTSISRYNRYIVLDRMDFGQLMIALVP